MKKIKNTEILITGGAGFIGSSIAESLIEKGASVTILDNMLVPYGGNLFNLKNIKKEIIFIKGDIRDEKLVKKHIKGKDFIFHLAAQTGRSISMKNPMLDTDINILGTLNILEAIKNLKIKPKLIYSGSRGVIGEPKYFPVDEKHPENPKDVYGINKLAAEKYCMLFGKEYGFDVTILRLNNVYGPKCQIKSNHYGTINLFISYALLGKTIPIYGDGSQTRDYVYVDDVVVSFILAMSEKADNEIYFVGSEIEVSLNEIVKIISKEIKDTHYKKVNFPIELKSVDFQRFYSTSNKIKKDLNWHAKISIEEGIIKTIKYYKSNINNYL